MSSTTDYSFMLPRYASDRFDFGECGPRLASKALVRALLRFLSRRNDRRIPSYLTALRSFARLLHGHAFSDNPRLRRGKRGELKSVRLRSHPTARDPPRGTFSRILSSQVTGHRANRLEPLSRFLFTETPKLLPPILCDDWPAGPVSINMKAPFGPTDLAVLGGVQRSSPGPVAAVNASVWGDFGSNNKTSGGCRCGPINSGLARGSKRIDQFPSIKSEITDYRVKRSGENRALVRPAEGPAALGLPIFDAPVLEPLDHFLPRKVCRVHDAADHRVRGPPGPGIDPFQSLELDLLHPLAGRPLSLHDVNRFGSRQSFRRR